MGGWAKRRNMLRIKQAVFSENIEPRTEFLYSYKKSVYRECPQYYKRLTASLFCSTIVCPLVRYKVFVIVRVHSIVTF